MDGAVAGTAQGATSGTASDGVHAPQLPLAFAAADQVVTVLKVRGNEEVQHHLENLGFVEGAAVKVVIENAGNLIVEVKGAQVALDKQIAMKIVVAA